MRAALLLLPLALCAACLRKTEFHCTLDNQCNPGGACQTAVGYCSFSDSGCPSGQRFGDSAGDDLANDCVGEQSGGDAGIDGPPIDGPPIDSPPAACPAEYVALAGGPAGHLYRKAPANLNWTGQDDYCRGTSTRAYLAIPDEAVELTSLHTLAAGTFWIGIHDRVIEGTYVKTTGGPATFLPWDTGAGEPDNPGGGGGQDCVAATATTISTEDCTGNGSTRPAVCECEP
jgi:hypothetical protein